MKKIFLLIIPLIFFLNINQVKAEETTDIWFKTGFNRFSLTNLGGTYPDNLPFSAYNNSFNLQYAWSMQNSNFKLPFVLYDTTNDLYILLIYEGGTNCSSDYKYFNIYGQYNLYCKDENGQEVSTSRNNAWYSILSTKDESTYVLNIDSGISPVATNNGTYYLTQDNSHRTYFTISSYLVNNKSDFKLVSTLPGYEIYLQGDLIPDYSSEDPEEPENPEDPEEPTTTSDYFYIPNYNENMCVEVIDKDTIRVFDNNDTLNYIEYYPNSHYISKTGSVDSEYIKNCSTLNFTSSEKYRSDLPDILFIALLVCGFTFIPCYMLFRVFYKRSR